MVGKTRRLALLAAMGGGLLPTLLVSAASPDEADPFAGNYILGNSAEAVLIWNFERPSFSAPEVPSTQRLYDVTGFGPVNAQIIPEDTRSDRGRFAAAGEGGMDVATGDFDGDDFDDVVAAWEGPNHRLAWPHCKVFPMTCGTTMTSL